MKLITLSGEGTLTLGLMLIKNAEGFSEVPYKDSLGNWTIGYGFDMATSEFSNLTEITETQADAILKQKIVRILSTKIKGMTLYDYGTKTTNAVLLDMCYNLGVEGLSSFDTFLTYIMQGKNEEAVADLTNTLWYSQVKERAVRNCLNILLKNESYLYLI